MKLLININNKEISIETDLEKKSLGSHDVYYSGLSSADSETFINLCINNEIESFLRETDISQFLLIYVHQNRVTIYNDLFGTNQIFFFEHQGSKVITNNILSVENFKPQIKAESVYEMAVFQGILPPDTIFNSVKTIPSGTRLEYANDSFKLKEYINIDSLFSKKEHNYDNLVEKGRSALMSSLDAYDIDSTGIALSGGVDSGGLLGMFTHLKGKNVKTVSLGGRGKDTFDLESARKSVDYHEAEPSEIYPTFQDIKKMAEYSRGLSQPVSASTLFVYSLIHDKAKEIGISNMVYGFGAEMLLGNLRIAKIADKL